MAKTKKTEKIKDIGGVLVFENFSFATLFQRETTPNENMHSFIISPTYLFKGVNKKHITDMNDVPYPLLANLPGGNINLATNDGAVVSFAIPSNTNDSRILYIATDKNWVKALSLTGIARNFGRPTTTILNNPNLILIILFSNVILFIHPQKISRISETSTDTNWTDVSGFNSPKFGETFSIYCYVADKNNVNDNNWRIIRALNTSFNISGSLDLGTFWDIQDIVNNNNKYLVLIVNPANVYFNQYLRLWDGSWQNTPFHSIKLPGIYVGSINYMGAFLVFLKEGGALKIYELSGYSLRLIDVLPGISVNENLLPKQRFSMIGNYIVFSANFPTVNINGLVFYNPLEKELILLNGETENNIRGIIGGFDLNNNYRIFYTDGSNDKIFQKLVIPSTSLDDYVNSGGTFSQTSSTLIYSSNIVQFLRKVKIYKVEVFMGDKPSNSNQKIILEINGFDRRSNQETSQNIEINQLSQNFYNVFNEVGIEGNEIQLKIYLLTDGSFRGNIKRVLIYYKTL